jgi:hypothetical protein
MHRPTLPVFRCPAFRIIGLAVLGLWLAGCGDSTPSAPNSGETAPDFTLSQGTTQVEIREDFGLLKPDGGVRVFLRARCPAGYQVLEGPVTVTQTPRTQEVFAEAFFSTTCDGRWHRVSVKAVPTEGRFRVGRAQLSVALIVENANGDLQSAGDTQVIRIVRRLPASLRK